VQQTWKIIVAIIITAILVGGGVYIWQNPKQPETQIKKTEGENQIISSEKFEGNGFSFSYPAQYVADDKGLWTEDGYELHINPAAQCSTCQIPFIEVKSETTTQSLDKYIITDFTLPGDTLKEMSERTNLSYSQERIGDNDFIKITVGDLYEVTGYYTKHNNQVLAFRVYWADRDTKELREIISTLQFK